MADNVTITKDANSTPPPNTVIATDDVSGAQYQRMKVDLGGDGVSSPLVRGQQAKAGSIPVTLASDEDTITIDGAVDATITNTITTTLSADATTVVQQETNTLLQEVIRQLKVNNLLLNIINDSNVTTSDV
jgi:hypothetical protein